MPSSPQIGHLKAGVWASIHVPSLGRLADPIWALSHVAVAELPGSVGYDPRPRCAGSLIPALAAATKKRRRERRRYNERLTYDDLRTEKDEENENLRSTGASAYPFFASKSIGGRGRLYV